VDGGIQRGTDILKAIALGATAVGVGRPYLYSLVYGEEGVEHLTESKFGAVGLVLLHADHDTQQS
jgi:isopentenyl diphosphate isomerase/L-lactate dehydrogenase-like FMN-dependent dehydrogenase